MTHEDYLAKMAKYDDFLDRVRSLANNNTGYAAVLRRAAGKRLAEVDAETLMAFYQAKRFNTNQTEEEKAFLVACLQCLWKGDEAVKPKSVPKIGSTLKDTARNTFQKRMLSALDMSWDSDGYLAMKLFRLVKFCKAKGAVVDCKLLLHDLLAWDYENRIVQKNWIRDFLAVNED